MSVKKHDEVSGYKTTGHEWDGITELNSPVPKAVWLFIGLTVFWSLILWVLMPAWPLVNGYTKGVLGVDQRDEVRADLRQAVATRAEWAEQIEALPLDQILADPALMETAQTVGHQLFGDNCAACHGVDARGGPGFPDLTDSDWLWGGDAGTVMETLRVGINARHTDTRAAQMLGFGRDGILSRSEIRTVARHVLSLSGEDKPTEDGAQIFAENCAACHGEDGTGNQEIGAPNLTDDAWIYGGDKPAIFATVFEGRSGVMPAWEDRLTETDRKILTAYVLNGQAKEAR